MNALDTAIDTMRAALAERVRAGCNYVNPAMIEEARALRAAAARAATTEDEYLAAAESHPDDYIPWCECAVCTHDPREG